MKPIQKRTLRAAIQVWLDQEAEDGFDFIVGDATVARMTDAAVAVWDACQESQQYAVREGYMQNWIETTSAPAAPKE